MSVKYYFTKRVCLITNQTYYVLLYQNLDCYTIMSLHFYDSEGLAVGVGFGAIGKTKAATFQNAR